MEKKIRQSKGFYVFGIVFSLVSLIALFLLVYTGLIFGSDVDNNPEIGWVVVLMVIYVIPLYGGAAVFSIVGYILGLITNNKILKGNYLQNGMFIATIVFFSIALVVAAATLVFALLFHVSVAIYVLVCIVVPVVALITACKQRVKVKQLACEPKVEYAVVAESATAENMDE